ncbi:MrcB family domain-containing protein, partial [Paracoccus liaowanqingii]|uniref:MrcB family domain-containing protein n=1 Tax=Paracoccus liaowanqingii TaxID=2560053 RepID=UPI00143E08EC
MTGSAFSSFFRRDVAALARALTDRRAERMLVRASTGAPGWASIPWLACFAPHVTRSMRHGLYVVIFIDPVGERIVLSLQHGAADALTRHGAAEGRRILRETAAATRAALAG